jgi:hypothetical protein
MRVALLWSLLLLSFSGISAPRFWAGSDKTREHYLSAPITRVDLGTKWAPQHLATLNQVKHFLQNAFPASRFGFFKAEKALQSPRGWHYTFVQTYEGRNLYQASVKVNTDLKGNLLNVISNLYDLPELLLGNTSNVEPVIAEKYLDSAFTANRHSLTYLVQEIAYVEDEMLEAGLLLTYGSFNTSLGSKEIIFDQQGRIISENNLITNYKHHPQQQDSAVVMQIFGPDPRTTTQKVVKDRADLDDPLLNQQRQRVKLNVNYVNDTFRLATPYCVIREFDSPKKPVCYSLKPAFEYTRCNDCFEQVNILYHISSLQEYVQKLGFTNLANYPIEADANGWGGADQSSFSPFTNTLSFGEGGVDDGEDADVIIHEYSHALSNAAAPGTNIGLERKVLEEANADYFAVSYSKSIDSTDWQNIFNWDGHNEYWSGRKAVSGKVYPLNLTGEIYQDAGIWTATLMQVQQKLGREITDALLLESLYSYSANLTLPDAALLLIQADRLMNGGQHEATLTELFVRRGILNGSVPGRVEATVSR